MNRRELMTSMTAAGACALLPAGVLSAARMDSASRIVVDGLDTSVLNDEFIALLKKGGVNSVQKSEEQLSALGELHEFIDAHSDQLTFATTVADIRAARASGKIALTTGAQHANYLEQVLDKSHVATYLPLAPALRAYYELGLRIQGICYNVANIFGGGCMDHRVPLTRVGARLVEEVHKLNIILDVGGHTGEQTSLDALEISKGVPVVCTHTNVAALNPNPRAISDRVAEAIATSGGVIGVTAISDFQMRSPQNYKTHGPRSPQASLDVHLDQYDYLKRLVGVDHIGLGPDVVWGWGDDFDQSNEISMTFPSDTLSNGPIMLVRDYENISKLPNVENGLRGRGWNQAELDKVLGGNWMRVYQRVWGG
jgi:membrane dipeptidase